MRILIVGAGIGGVTLAALLRQRGVSATVVEKAPNFDHAGYMIGLYCLGSRVLNGLDAYDSLARQSVPMASYEVHDGHGKLIQSWSMESLDQRFGPFLGITRPQLVQHLAGCLEPGQIRFGTAIEAIEQQNGEVIATFSDGTREGFDLLVGADGMHSKVRTLVFGEQPSYRTGWGGWVWWGDPASVERGKAVEYWGAGRFLGAYPTPKGPGVIACAPIEHGFETSGPGRGDRIRQRFAGLGQPAEAFLASLPGDDVELFFWNLLDVRSAEWTKGRVVLLGDAAAGFLPTAGVGASMAMESAAVLADELSRTDNRFLEHSLSLYVKRRKRRVEGLQDDSRTLARLMFVSSSTIAAVRDLATRFFTMDAFAKSIAKLFDDPI